MQFEETRIEKMILNLLTYKILSLSLFCRYSTSKMLMTRILYPHAYTFKSQPRIPRSREVSRASVEFSISPKKYTRLPRERGRRGKAEQQKHGQ